MRIDKLHPCYSKDESEDNVRDRREKRVAKGLECVREHVVCRLDSCEEGDEEDALHPIVYGSRRGCSYYNFEPQSACEINTYTKSAGDENAKAEYVPKCAFDASGISGTDVLSKHCSGCNSKASSKG